MIATLEQEIYEEHARQAAFLWRLRDSAARDVAYDLPDLAELDDRLEAHLDGLRLAGEGGWDACEALLDDPEGGEVFGAAVIAVDRWDLRGVARVLDTFDGAPDLARGFVAALAWTPFDRVRKLLPGLLAGRAPPRPALARPRRLRRPPPGPRAAARRRALLRACPPEGPRPPRRRRAGPRRPSPRAPPRAPLRRRGVSLLGRLVRRPLR